MAILAVACALLVPAVASAADGSIAGKVTEAAAGHAPIEGVEVCAEGVGATEDFACDFTDAAGDYSVPALTPGNYKVEFWGVELGYFLQYYDGKSRWSEADEVPVASATATPNIDAELVEGAKIEGTVTDSVSKAGIGDVSVCAWSETEEELGCGWTNGSGEYRIGGLVDSEYEVRFWAVEDPDYVIQYYDGKTNWEEATLVPAAVGSPATGIDAELFKGGRIAGTVGSAANGQPLSGIAVCAREAGGEYAGYCDFTNGLGRYTLLGLPTGSYGVEFSPEFEGLPPDVYPTEYYDDKPTLAQAQLVAVTAPLTTSGIDALLGAPPASVVLSPVISTLPTGKPIEKKPKPKKCRKGFKRKKVKGKSRCVRIAKRGPKGKAGKSDAGHLPFAPAPRFP